MDKKLLFYLDNTNFKEKTQTKKQVEIRHSNKKDDSILKIVNGEICIDDNDMFVNMVKSEDMEVIEDTEIVTSNTYSKKKMYIRWSSQETKLFYEALSLCGTEFSLIAEIFGKDRRVCKLKYQNELRKNSIGVLNALSNKVLFTPEGINKLKEKVKFIREVVKKQ